MSEDASRRWQREDKFRQPWNLYQIDYPTMFSLYAQLGTVGLLCEAHVKTHEIVKMHGEEFSLQSSMAFLGDVRVNQRFENRGVGSMLVEEAIAECKRRGHVGIEGRLSEADRDHFGKLEHFYTKLGFSVVFYRLEAPEYRELGPGKVALEFES